MRIIYDGTNAGQVVAIIQNIPYNNADYKVYSPDWTFMVQSPTKEGWEARIIKIDDCIWRENDTKWGIIRKGSEIIWAQ